ncbi:hypothetical protein D3C80_1096620 [compost metagenome]
MHGVKEVGLLRRFAQRQRQTSPAQGPHRRPPPCQNRARNRAAPSVPNQDGQGAPRRRRQTRDRASIGLRQPRQHPRRRLHPPAVLARRDFKAPIPDRRHARPHGHGLRRAPLHLARLAHQQNRRPGRLDPRAHQPRRKVLAGCKPHPQPFQPLPARRNRSAPRAQQGRRQPGGRGLARDFDNAGPGETTTELPSPSRGEGLGMGVYRRILMV